MVRIEMDEVKVLLLCYVEFVLYNFANEGISSFFLKKSLIV